MECPSRRIVFGYHTTMGRGRSDSAVESLSERDEPHRGAAPSGKVQEMEICQETELP